MRFNLEFERDIEHKSSTSDTYDLPEVCIYFRVLARGIDGQLPILTFRLTLEC